MISHPCAYIGWQVGVIVNVMLMGMSATISMAARPARCFL